MQKLYPEVKDLKVISRKTLLGPPDKVVVKKGREEDEEYNKHSHN